MFIRQLIEMLKMNEGDEASCDITNEKMYCNSAAARPNDWNSGMQRYKLRND